MSYQVNLPYSVQLRPNGPALYAPPPKPIEKLGYFFETPTLSITSGDPGLDNIIKYGFWLGMAIALYKLYGMLRYDEPLFSPGTPPAWKANPSKRRKKSEYDEKRARIIAYYEPGMNVSELARVFGVDTKTAIRWLEVEGVYVAGKMGPRRDEDIFQKALSLYQPGEPVGPVARKIGVDPTTVIAWMKEAGIYEPAPRGFPVGKKQPARKRSLGPKRLAIRKYLTKHYEPEMSIPTLAKEFDLPASTVRRWLKEDGIYIPGKSGRSRDEELYQKALSLYRPGYPVGPVAKEVGVSMTTVINWAKEAGIYKPAPVGAQESRMSYRERYR